MLLGIDWAFDMDAVINLKKQNMTLERKALRVVVPLNPIKGVHYTEPVHDFMNDNYDLDQIYKIIVRKKIGSILWPMDELCWIGTTLNFIFR